MPLIMEPLSAFYSSPLVVLDFQSLYPSIMIAYNYCYSTCLGRVTEFKGESKFGVTKLDQPSGLLETLSDHITGKGICFPAGNSFEYVTTVAPNGMMYVKPDVRKGLLARMLSELLETRIMVKHAMKGVKNDKVHFTPFNRLRSDFTDICCRLYERFLTPANLASNTYPT